MRRVALKFIRDPRLRTLLYGAGSLSQARNELRWIEQELVDRAQISRAVRLRGKFGYPLQYLLGSQPFGKLEIACRPGVLIPRWETEEWAQQLAAELAATTAADQTTNMVPQSSDNLRIVDFGTGSGCILFHLLDSLPQAQGIGVDVSEAALQLFEHNRANLGAQQRSEALKHSIFTPLAADSPLRDADVVVSNPPYIESLADAQAPVREFEPHLALLATPQIYENLVARVMETRASRAVFEVGNEQQIELCRRLFAAHGWEAHGRRDGAGQWRTLWAKKTKGEEN